MCPKLLLTTLSLFLLLAACTPTPTPEPIAALLEVTAVPPTRTVPPVLTATATPLATGTAVATHTNIPPTPTNTPEPTPTVPIWVAAGTAVPQTSAIISPENAGQLTELARWARGVIQSVSYTADGQQIKVETATGIYLHDANSLNGIVRAPTTHFPGNPVSPNGEFVAIKPTGSSIQLQRSDDASLVVTLPGSEYMQAVTFSPDSQLLVTKADSFMQLWQIRDGSQLFEGQAVALSLDGNLIAVSVDNIVTIYHWPTLEVVSTVIPSETTTDEDEGWHDYSRDVTSLAFSPDSLQLAVGMRPSAYITRGGSAIELFRVNDGQMTLQLASMNSFEPTSDFECDETYQAHPPSPIPIREIIFSPDGQFFAAIDDYGNYRAYGTNQIRLHQADTGTLIRVFDEDIEDVAFAPDSQTIVSSSQKGLVQLWRTSDGTLLQTVGGYDAQTSLLTFSPDGQILAGKSENGVNLYQTTDGALLSQFPQATAISFAKNGTVFSVGYEDGTIEWWLTDDITLLNRVNAHSGKVTALTFTTDSEMLVSAGYDCEWHLWQRGALIQSFNPYLSPSIYVAPDAPTGIRHLVSLPNGETIAALFSGYPSDFREHADLGFWQLTDGTFLNIPEELPADLESIAFSSDGQQMALDGGPYGLTVWQFDSNFNLVQKWNKEIYGSGSIAFSPDGTLLGAGNQLILLANGDVLTAIPVFNEDVTSVAFSPDGRILAIGSTDGTVRLWGIP